MIDAAMTGECRDLRALLEERATDEDEGLAAILAAHIASCVTCSTAEAVLTGAIADYCSGGEPSLPDGLERRLLDQVCPPTCGHSESKAPWRATSAP
jgi:hypothetical protein